ncbi:uncharacterized protein [Epargyreus clarus]|uniref:uncharacterized protein n=1 Tax=Epargyreus clarus TaxID=520877 RepID=UPI003C2E28FE
MGERFPTKYLVPEEVVLTAADLEYYTISLHRVVKYFNEEIIRRNETDVNRALGMFFMKALLKRTIRDYRDKLTNTHYNILKDIIHKGEELVTNYVHTIKDLYGDDFNTLENRVAKLLRDDTAQVYSIENFNKGRMLKWIHSNISMHSYSEQMDTLTLAREKYAYISEVMDLFFVNIVESDECISHIMYNPEPIHLSEMKPCRPDPYCRKALLSSPSAAYALSHRLLNVLLLRQCRRCYIQTEQEDLELMDSLCAFMYREAVYLARRGYFAKDLFLEHVALCALLGYEEFYRHQWFRKAASWIDDNGCIFETHNFMINQTRIERQREENVKRHNEISKRLKYLIIEECHSHPMALLLIVLAHAIRHTLNFMV